MPSMTAVTLRVFEAGRLVPEIRVIMDGAEVPSAVRAVCLAAGGNLTDFPSAGQPRSRLGCVQEKSRTPCKFQEPDATKLPVQNICMHDNNKDGSIFSRARGVLMPDCHEMARRSSLAMDAPLPVAQRIGVAAHLLVCGLCRRYRTQLRWLRGGAKKSASSSVVRGSLPPAAASRIKRSLRATGASNVGSAA